MTRTGITAAVLLVALGMSAQARASDADVCYGPTTTTQQAKPLDDTTVFKCPRAGSHTLPDLARAGWIVVQVTSAVVGSAKGTAPTTFADRLILRKN